MIKSLFCVTVKWMVVFLFILIEFASTASADLPKLVKNALNKELAVEITKEEYLSLSDVEKARHLEAVSKKILSRFTITTEELSSDHPEVRQILELHRNNEQKNDSPTNKRQSSSGFESKSKEVPDGKNIHHYSEVKNSENEVKSLDDSLTNGCPKALKQFGRECEIYAKYNSLKERFAKHGIDIDNVTGYKARRLIAQRDFIPEKSQSGDEEKKDIYKPWNIYEPKPKTWIYWEKGNYFREQLNRSLDSREEWGLTVQDLTNLHTKVIDSELLGKSQHFFATVAPSVFKKIAPLPGNFRSGSNINSGFSGVFTEEEKNHIENYDLLNSKGQPYIKGQFQQVGKNKYKGRVTYTDSSEVATETEHFLEELNAGVNYFLGNPSNPKNYRKFKFNETPYEFAARMQKVYVSIHPFHESNGRMSRLIQDLILKKLGLPFVQGGFLQNDVTTPTPVYKELTLAVAYSTLSSLESCLVYYEEKVTPPGECDAIYGRGQEESKESDNEDQLERSVILHEIRSRILDEHLTPASTPPCPRRISLDESLITQIESIRDITDASLTKPKSKHSGISDQRKRLFLEELAKPLEQDRRTYSWVQGSMAAISRKTIYSNASLFKRLVVGNTSEIIPGKTKMGNGLYVSKTPYDSSQFALSEKDQSILSGHIKNKNPIAAYEHSRKSDNGSVLLAVTIKAGQRVLDLNDPHVQQQMKRMGISQEDAARLNPNLIIDFDNQAVDPEKRKAWMVIKSTDPNAFTVEEATPAGFSQEEVRQIKKWHQNKKFLGGHKFYENVLKHHGLLEDNKDE